MAQNTAAVPKPTTVNPSEVGWQFVPQYYTYVNKQPGKLHCFYTKNSTFIHGTEGENGKPYYGQQEIHNKILSLNYNNCKVFIHSVDAQSSANNGIIIQVIGEMSNAGEPWRKFVQTFFLAEQPNGYFVLNDIFRYLKEELVGEDDEEGEASEDVADQPLEDHEAVSEEPKNELPSPPQVQYTAPAEPIPIAPEPQVVAPPTPEPAPKPLTPIPADPPAAVPVNGINGTAAHEPPVERPPTPPPVESQTIPEAPVEPPQEPEPVVSAPAAVPPPTPIAAPPIPAPAPTAAPVPSGPKTWATLAASNNRQWGKQIATDAKGISAAGPAAASAPAPAPAAAPHPRPQGGRPDGHPGLQAAQALTSAQCFVKGVTEVVSQIALTDALTSRFGPLKDVEIIRNKACAFLEFTTVEAARKAIIASLPIPQGGEGGIRLEVDAGIQARITVETRKERGERPPSRPHRGGPPGGAPGGQQGGQQSGSGGHEGGSSGFRGGPGGRGGRGQPRGRGGPPNK